MIKLFSLYCSLTIFFYIFLIRSKIESFGYHDGLLNPDSLMMFGLSILLLIVARKINKKNE